MPHRSMAYDMKTCSKCGEDKPLTDFHKHKQTKSGYKSRCKVCNTAAATSYRNANIEKVRAKGRARYIVKPRKLPQTLAEVRAKDAEYRRNNKTKIKAARKKWKLENKDWGASNAADRRARKLNATPIWIDREVVKSIYTKAHIRGLHVDHIIPLRSQTVCGLHWESNLQLLHPLENFRKGNSYLEDA